MRTARDGTRPARSPSHARVSRGVRNRPGGSALAGPERLAGQAWERPGQPWSPGPTSLPSRPSQPSLPSWPAAGFRPGRRFAAVEVGASGLAATGLAAVACRADDFAGTALRPTARPAASSRSLRAGGRSPERRRGRRGLRRLCRRCRRGRLGGLRGARRGGLGGSLGTRGRSRSDRRGGCCRDGAATTTGARRPVPPRVRLRPPAPAWRLGIEIGAGRAALPSHRCRRRAACGRGLAATAGGRHRLGGNGRTGASRRPGRRASRAASAIGPGRRRRARSPSMAWAISGVARSIPRRWAWNAATWRVTVSPSFITSRAYRGAGSAISRSGT